MTERVRLLLGILLASAWPLALQPQQTATITGRVTDAGSRPLSDARVQVVGTARWTATAPDGRYRIAGVPPGMHELRVLRLGYASQIRSIMMRTDETTDVDFSLIETASMLDQVVVTASGETQRRRESGASVGTIDTAMINTAPTPLLSNVLSSRMPGLTVQEASGTTGTGSRVRIRGSNSINLSNDPLLIVDGARVNNSASSFQISVGGQVISRLDDFNPEDIESIDVIKGPAATALYGTAAANGVIQITTKKGRVGVARWNWYEEYGTIHEVLDYPTNYTQVGTSLTTGASQLGCTLERQVLRICAPKPDSLLSWNPIENVSPFMTGWRLTHGLNTHGGSDILTYYVGAEVEREQGVYAVNQLGRVSGRSNVRMRLRNDLDATVSIGLLRNRLQLPYNDNTAFGAISAGLLGKAFDCSPTTFRTVTYCGADSLSRGYITANSPSTQYFDIDNNQQLDRLTASVQSNYYPLPWLRGIAQAGMDVVNRLDEQMLPPGKILFNQLSLEGSRFQARVRIPTYTVSGAATATYPVPGIMGLRGQSTASTQYVREDFRLMSAAGSVMLPGTASLSGTSARFVVNETNQEIITLGYFLQQQLTHRDRFFLTLGVRSDRNSAFGTRLKWVPYPAASVSWVISDESFFPRTRFVDQLRLRTAWGQSGHRPVFRDAATFFSPVSVSVAGVESAAFTVGGTGNPTLSPEVSTEFEGGFEGSLFRNRLSFELTGYAKTTDDAIVVRRLAPSLGMTTTQFTNLGVVENTGVEALTIVKMLDLPNVEWSTTVSAMWNRNTLIKLGESQQQKLPLLFGPRLVQQHREGYPLGSYFERKIVSFADLDNNGIITRINCPAYESALNPQLVGGPRCEVVLSDSVEYLGNPIPTREASVTTDFTLWRLVRLTALLDYRGGYKNYNATTEFRCVNLGVPNCVEAYDKSSPFDRQVRLVASAMANESGYVEDASFVKLRELALQLTAPRAWAGRAHVGGLSLTLAARNLATWTDYTGLDPEVNANAGTNFITSDFLTQPPVRYFVTRLTVNF